VKKKEKQTEKVVLGPLSSKTENTNNKKKKKKNSKKTKKGHKTAWGVDASVGTKIKKAGVFEQTEK